LNKSIQISGEGINIADLIICFMLTNFCIPWDMMQNSVIMFVALCVGNAKSLSPS